MYRSNLLNDAMTVLQESKIVSNNCADKAYNGAIAAFGAALIQSGLLTTLAMYKHDSGDASRPKIMDALFRMIKHHHIGIPTPTENESDLLEYALHHYQTHLPLIEKRVTEAAIALKLALRTFKLIKS